jgi:anhydro-N-acetylmuramic acid kinase
MKVVGLMSGTSADGVDAALVNIVRRAGRPKITPIAFASVPYPRSLQQRLVDVSLQGHVAEICHLNTYLGEVFAKAALKVIRVAKYHPADIQAIGSHGQTIHHLPKGTREPGVGLIRSTLQIGEPAVIAERTGITTVANFRPRDMAAGGEGAPLVPYAHAIAFSHARRTRLIVNIGGISNVTYLPAGGEVVDIRAFDTGPGNMVLDAIVREATQGTRAYDAGGRWARQGTVNQALLRELMAHPFLSRRPPKSTGREEFGAPIVRALLDKQNKVRLSMEDLLATCAAWTAEAIGSSRRWLPGKVDDVIVGGGGVSNHAIMAALRTLFAPAPVLTFEDCGWSSKAFEATAFALLAYDLLQGHCTNIPQVTGARHPVLLGSVVPGRAGRRGKGLSLPQ